MQTGGVLALRLFGTLGDALESTRAAAMFAPSLREPDSFPLRVDEKESAVEAQELEPKIVANDAGEVFVEHEHAVTWRVSERGHAKSRAFSS